MMALSMTAFTLSAAQVYAAAALFSLILALISVTGIKLYAKEPKRLAWFISLINSGLLTLLGFYYLYYKVSTDSDFFVMKAENAVHFTGRTDFCVLICLWFALANIFDIAVGLVYYRKYLGLLTAYIHHSVFIWIMFTSTTGNGLFVEVTPFCPTFITLIIEELPTFLLALGSIFPEFRTDIGFGVTFFLFRIALHAYFFIYVVKVQAQTTVITLFTLTMLMHLNWFYSWVTKYGSNAVKPKKTV
jgi:hypothetical protein